MIELDGGFLGWLSWMVVELDGGFFEVWIFLG